jgi:hypothetical protein
LLDGHVGERFPDDCGSVHYRRSTLLSRERRETAGFEDIDPGTAETMTVHPWAGVGRAMVALPPCARCRHRVRTRRRITTSSWNSLWGGRCGCRTPLRGVWSIFCTGGTRKQENGGRRRQSSPNVRQAYTPPRRPFSRTARIQAGAQKASARLNPALLVHGCASGSMVKNPSKSKKR